jgi:hypothetical protein
LRFVPKWGIGVEAGGKSADDASVPADPTNLNPDSSDQQVLEELPAPRVGAESKGEPAVAQRKGEDGTWAEFKPSKDTDDDFGGYGANEPKDEARSELSVQERTKKNVSVLLYTLIHIRDPRQRRRLLIAVKRRRAMLASGALAFIGVACLIAAVGFSLARSAPSWWVDVDKESIRNIELADQVQNLSITYIHADHDSLVEGVSQWPVKMTDEAANAWLNINMPGWFTKISDGMDWPESISQVQMVFDNGTVHLGVRVRTEIGTRIYSCAIVPELHDDGSLWMKARTVSMGRLKLPASWVLRGAESHAGGFIPEELRGTAEAEALFEKLTGKLPLFDVAEVKLGDGRRVRLLDLRVRDGSIITLFETKDAG